jgi:hypothetical protein
MTLTGPPEAHAHGKWESIVAAADTLPGLARPALQA